MDELKYIEINNFTTLSGKVYPKIKLTYQLFGQPLGEAPVIVVNHALTGNSQVIGKEGWWNQTVGEGQPSQGGTPYGLQGMDSPRCSAYLPFRFGTIGSGACGYSFGELLRRRYRLGDVGTCPPICYSLFCRGYRLEDYRLGYRQLPDPRAPFGRE